MFRVRDVGIVTMNALHHHANSAMVNAFNELHYFYVDSSAYYISIHQSTIHQSLIFENTSCTMYERYQYALKREDDNGFQYAAIEP